MALSRSAQAESIAGDDAVATVSYRTAIVGKIAHTFPLQIKPKHFSFITQYNRELLNLHCIDLK